MNNTLPKPHYFGLCLGALFALLFLLFYGSANLLTEVVAWRIAPALPFEAAIPLVPAWSIVYLSMPLLLCYGIVKLDWTAQWALFAVLLAELLLACVCFLLLPVQMSYPPDNSASVWRPVFEFATTLSMANNHLPSLHVAFACSAGLALQRVVPRWQAVLLWLWVMLIAVSTVMIHEHHLLDLVAAVGLVVLVEKIVRPLALSAKVLQRVRLEWLWWYNQFLFAHRHRRYALITLMITVQRLARPRRGNLLVSGYCFLQAFDDIMDGDRTSSQSPLELSQALIRTWQRNTFNQDDDLMCLAADFHQRLLAVTGDERAVAEVCELLHVMQSDYLRASQREVWSAVKLVQQHQQTFSLSLNLLLSGLGSTARADDIPELIAVLGWCSTIRDLRDDLHAGIINLPAEVLPSTLPALSSTKAIDDLLQRPAVSYWIAQQHRQAEALLWDLEQRLQNAPLDSTGERVVRLFARSVAAFAKRSQATHLNPTARP